MLAKSLLKTASVLKEKDIKELKSIMTPSGRTSCGRDIRELRSAFSYDELQSMLTADELKMLKRCDELYDRAIGDAAGAIDRLKGLVNILLTMGRGVDRPLYAKTLSKLDKLRTMLEGD